MTENDNKLVSPTAIPEVKRLRASGPILILAVLFVGGAFLSWYFSWFGRSLSDEDISQYLVDEKKPRHVQHALLQIQQRIERGDPNAKQWYPQIVKLSSHPETEFRLTTAWLMGFDPKADEFHQALMPLVSDAEPIVRRNAALALVRFGDARGRPELLAMLKPHEVQTPVAGKVASTLKEGAQLARGTLLARLTQTDGKMVEVRSPLPGKLEHILTPAGSDVTAGTALATINSDEDSVWEGLRALALIGQPEDQPFIERYVNAAAQSDRVKQQAALTVRAIQNRSTKTH